MRNKLIIGSYENSYAKLIEYGNLIHHEGYEISQVWQSEDNYEECGINFKEEDSENLMLIREGELLYLEMDYENKQDIFKIINIRNIIEVYEQSTLEE